VTIAGRVTICRRQPRGPSDRPCTPEKHMLRPSPSFSTSGVLSTAMFSRFLSRPVSSCLFADQRSTISAARLEPPICLDAFAFEYRQDTAGFAQITPAEIGGPKHGEVVRPHS
jgi:hypothetical protein